MNYLHSDQRKIIITIMILVVLYLAIMFVAGSALAAGTSGADSSGAQRSSLIEDASGVEVGQPADQSSLEDEQGKFPYTANNLLTISFLIGLALVGASLFTKAWLSGRDQAIDERRISSADGFDADQK